MTPKLVNSCCICMKEPACYRITGEGVGFENGWCRSSEVIMLIGKKCSDKITKNIKALKEIKPDDL
jgi:hypothetical protein